MADRTEYMREYYIRTAEKRKAAAKKWKADNPDRVREYQSRRNRSLAGKTSALKCRLKKYGLSISDYKSILESQNNRCGACGRDRHTLRDWHIDHCHKTGRVRGILCHRCNLAIGYAKDDPRRLRAMADYLDRLT